MKIMDDDINWMKLTHMLSVFFLLHLSPSPLLYIYLYFKKIIALLDLHTKENDASPLYTLCTLMPQKIPLSTLMVVRMCFEQPPRVA